MTLNAHFRNATGDTVTGESALVLHLAPPSDTPLKTVGLYSLQNYTFSLAPHEHQRWSGS